MTSMLLLGVVLARLGVALLELLIKRANIAAALVAGLLQPGAVKVLSTCSVMSGSRVVGMGGNW